MNKTLKMLLGAVLLAGTAQVAIGANMVPVVAVGPLADAATLVNGGIAAERLDQIRRNGMEVQVLSGVVIDKQTRYCFVRMGLSYPDVKGRNSRGPNNALTAFYRNAMSDPQDVCLREAAKSTLDEFNGTAWDRLVMEQQRLQPRAPVQKRDARPGEFMTSDSGLDEPSQRLMIDMVGKSIVPKLFDYRQVSTRVDMMFGQFDDVFVCVAESGLVATPNDQRNDRNPSAFWQGAVVVPAAQGERTCRLAATRASLNALFNAAWNQAGVFHNFAATREDGVALPDLRAASARVSAMNQPQAAPARATAAKAAPAGGLSPQCRTFFQHYPDGQIPESSDDARDAYGISNRDDQLFTLMMACNAQRNR